MDWQQKTSLAAYLQTATFNSKITEVENKINTNDALTKVAGTKINNAETDLDGFKKSDLTGYAKKSEVANDITTIKNDYVTNASLSAQLNHLKSQHIADEVKKVDDKTKKIANDILVNNNKINQNKDINAELEREASFNRGMYHYLENSYLVYKCTNSSFKYHTNSSRINLWISKGIDETEKVTGAGNSKTEWPTVLDNGRMYVKTKWRVF